MALGIGCFLHVGRWLLLVCLINQCRSTVASDSSSLASDSSGGWQQGAQSDQKEDCNIPRMPNFNLTLFQSIYEHRQPVIFPRLNLTSKLADLASSWTREALLTAHGNQRVRVGDTDEILKNDLDGERTLMLHKFISEMRDEENEELHMVDREFLNSVPELKNLSMALLPAVFEAEAEYYAGLSPDTSGMPFQYGQAFTQLLFYGQKIWFLLEPKTKPTPRHFGPFSQWISNSFLKTENNEVLDCIQRPDEVIYVPEGWHYGSLNVGETVTVGQRADMSKDAAISLRSLARRKKESGDLPGAVEIYELMITRFPNHKAETLRTLGEALMDLTENDESMQSNRTEMKRIRGIILQSIKLDPKHWVPYHTLCRDCLVNKQYDRALRACNKATTIFENNYYLQFSRAAALRHLERDAEAAHAYEVAELLNPRDSSAPYFKGLCLHKSGEPELAIAAYYQSLELSKDAEVYENLGVLLAEMDNYTEAVVAFKEAMVLDPELEEKYSDIVAELEQMSKWTSDDL